MKISVVVPCYNEEASLPVFLPKLKENLAKIGYQNEIIFIDDGSTDKTLQILKDFAETDKEVKYLSFSRNFGKEAAMFAGFSNATGDLVAVMDADLQDPPELLPQMVEILKTDDYTCVATRRISRKGEPILRSFFAKCFYRLINKISATEIVDGARDYRLMKRKMVDAIIKINETNRFSKGIFGWLGFKTYWLPFENKERSGGKSKWSFRKLLSYAVDGIVNYSDVPLNFAAFSGIIATFIAFLSLIFIIVRKLIFDDPVAGWASTVSIVIFLGGIQLLCLGIIGKYLAKTYLETKRRPHYIVSDTNCEDADLTN